MPLSGLGLVDPVYQGRRAFALAPGFHIPRLWRCHRGFLQIFNVPTSMSLLRIIWQDILWLNTLRPAIKIPGLILLLGLIIGSWYLGREFWNVKGFIAKGGGRLAPRWEFYAVVFGIAFLCYMVWVIERARKNR